MEFNVLATGLIFAVAVGYAATAPRVSGRRSSGAAASRWSSRVGLPVPEALRSRLEAQLLAQRVGAEVGAALLLAATTLWGLTMGRAALGSSWWPIVVISSLIVGGAVGNAAAALRIATTTDDRRSLRIARPTVVRLVEYVPPLERLAAPLVALSPVGLLLLLLGLRPDAGLAGPVFAAGTSVALAVLAELAARWVLALPQPAGSDLELAWLDAIRAQVLRSIMAAPVAVGVYAGAAVLSAFNLEELDPYGAGGVAVASILTLAFAAGVTVIVWTRSGTPHRYFRARLWPGEGPSLTGSPGDLR